MAVTAIYSSPLLSGVITTWTSLPTPSSMELGWMSIVTESKRTVGKNALLHKQLLGMKRKISCTWNYLTPAQYKKLEDLHKNNFFTIKYYDPQNTTSMTQRVMYGGDIESKVVRIGGTNGKIIAYKNVSWNFIER